MNDKFLNAFIERFEQPTYEKKVNPDYIETYKGKLPDKLLEYWGKLGFSGFKNGLFWITDPAEYEGILNSWIKNTELEKIDTFYVIARSGFGDLYLWGTKTGCQYEINTYNGYIYEGNNVEKDIKNGKENLKVQVFFSGRSPERINIKLQNKKLLFKDAVKKFGPLEPDEMFTFEPALFIGGNKSLENLNKVNLHIQHSILADFSERQIIDMDDLKNMAFG